MYIWTINSTDTARYAPYLDLHLEIDQDRFITKLLDKRDDFIFLIVKFPFICSNIPAAPAYAVYISPQSIRYSYACGTDHDFLPGG
jgi:hypothetical protein